MANDYPILMFPKAKKDVKTKRQVPPQKPRVPSANENAIRMSPKFEELQQTLDRLGLQIQQGVSGVSPEGVLVLETAGRVSDFRRAVEQIDGMEWLMEEDFDGEADDAFYIANEDGEPTKRTLKSRLYLVSTNQTSLNNLVSLYKRYTDNPQMEFDPGLTGFKPVFEQLRDIRFWSYKDRLDGSDTFEQWLQLHEAIPDKKLRFQIELWYRNNAERRTKAQKDVESLVSSSGGRVISSCTLEAIRYHALLVEVEGGSLRQIVDGLSSGSLIHSPEIMYFKPMPQTVFGFDTTEESELLEEAINEPLPSGNPIVALLDGFPQSNHGLLRGRLIVEDPDGFESQYGDAKKMKHGTTMASLIIHGDLSSRGEALDTPLLVRPIMVPFGDSEEMPEDMLAVDLVQRAVKRLFEGENGNPAVAPTVKIINFSIGDQMRQFDRTMSPMAKLLDWLSWKYEVLFIISAGNHLDTFTFDGSFADFKRKGQNAISKFVTKALLDSQLNRRMLSPAESMNNLTVGAVHHDGVLCKTDGDVVNPYPCKHPAVYTSFGNGYKNSVKPDLVYDGGCQTLLAYRKGPQTLEPYTQCMKPGQKVAWPNSNIGMAAYTRGTSNATALISRHAYSCYKVLREILDVNNKPDSHIHLLLKALVAHGCSWDEIGENINKFLPAGTSKVKAKAIKRQLIGYGYPDFEKSLICNPNRVTVLGFDELKVGEAHIYNMPLPSFLQGKKIKRRLTVTLSWMSPIASQNQKYRQTKFWYEFVENKDIAKKRVSLADDKAPRNGTLQHEVFEEEKRYPFPDESYLAIKVNCADDAGGCDRPVKYAIAVTLELGEGVQLGLFEQSIYDEVRDRLSVKVPVTPIANT